MSSSIESSILSSLAPSNPNSSSTLNTWTLFTSLPSDAGVTHDQIIGVSKSLAADAMLLITAQKVSYFQLTKEGTETATSGSQEVKVFNALKASGQGGLTRAEMEEAVGKDVVKVGMGNCLKNRWIVKEGEKLMPAVDSGQFEC